MVKKAKTPALTRTSAVNTKLKLPDGPVVECQNLLAGILEFTTAAIIAVDENRCILYFNKGAEQTFCYTAEEILGQSLDVLMPARFRKKHRKQVKDFSSSSIDRKIMTEREEIVGLRCDGTEFPAVASISKYKIAGKSIFTTLVNDISEIKNIEEKILIAKKETDLANRAQTEFLANISHELRTPLNAVIGFSDVLSNEMYGDLGHPKYLDYAKSIKKSGNHLLAVIKDILDTSKINIGQITLDEDIVDVRKLILDCKTMIRARADNSRIVLSSRVDTNASTIFADELRLKQILLNLLSNAVKFTKPQGRVSIRVGLDSQRVIRLKVTDTGIGIKPEDIPKVFQPFRQVNNIMTRTHDGTGLGLSISKGLSELHGATLNIKSKVGKGTTVTVTFPKERTVAGGSFKESLDR